MRPSKPALTRRQKTGLEVIWAGHVMEFETPAPCAEWLPRVRELVRAEVEPLERKGKTFAALGPELEAARKEVRAAGFWAPTLPRELGGMGLSLLEFTFLGEVIGRSPFGPYCFNCQAPDVGNMEVLLHHGSPEQKRTYLEPLAAGAIRSCFSMTEPDRAGSNPLWLDTTALREGDHYVISGRKWFTSSAEGAAFAIVMAVTQPQAAPHARASQILVPLSTPGFRLVRNVSMMGEAGVGYASHAEVAYENCRVPVSSRLGEEGMGFAIAQERLGPGRIHHCVRWLGISERALELMCHRALTRELAPGEPLAGRHGIQEWIAESRAELHGARLMVQQAAWRMDKDGTRGARDEIAMIKFTVAGVMLRIVDRALQIHGALGMTDETPLAAWYRYERAARIYDGPDEVHKASLAKRTLKQYGRGP